ncbi:MAG TPA: glycerol-3-phosphate dehydrogenase [Stellaceae bacterium]|nr:glycerol-3-phosphate dehydrogenase [Stellaceae bacterium]
MIGRYDLAVIGGGINGCGIARDAAGRGLKVLLCEKGDLAGGTSSASSKMIHGGLRYLERYDFKLVRESLAERAVLLRSAPGLVRPMRFVLPHAPGLRPRWMVRAGLFLYDHLGGAGALPGTESIRLDGDPRGAPLNGRASHAFVYSDCVVDDARLTVAVARDAALHGAEIATRTALVAARREAAAWHLGLSDGREIETRILVNAAGPWAAGIQRLAGLKSGARLRLVKGSHIVTTRLYDGDHAYLFQNDDRRVLFVIPYERDFTLIGTTDIPFDGDPTSPAIDAGETAYLLEAAGRWLRDPPREADIVWSYAGVRPLYDDGAGSASEITRDYVFDLDTAGAPALSVFGGKLTTFRCLAEHALDRLGIPGAWTATARLPEGREPGLENDDLRWYAKHEWARTAEDVLWRRTKLGLRAGPEVVARVSATMADAAGLPAARTPGP